MPDGYAMMSAVRDDEGQIIDFCYDFANAALCSMMGLRDGELTGKRLLELFPDHRRSGLFDAYCRLVGTGERLTREDVVYHGSVDGREIELVLDLRAVRLGDGYAVTGRDITERKRHEAERERLQARLMRLYALVIDANGGIVGAATADELFERICRVSVETAGFALAVIGLLDRESGLVMPVAASGAKSYLGGLRITVAPDDESARGPTGTALREARVVICNDVASDPLMKPWRERALAHGFAASGAFPLLDDGAAIGVFSVYATEVGWFTKQESGLLEQLALDMSFALRAKQQELELRSAERFLKALTDSMVEGMFALDEQGCVTYMNRAAEQMLGWSADELRGRSMHDATHYQHEDGSPYPVEDCPLLQVRTAGASIFIDDDVFTRRNGELAPVAYSASPIVDGSTQGSVVVFYDISDRKLEERRRQDEVEALSWVGRIRDALDDDRLILYAQPIIDIRTSEVVSHELLLRIVDPHGAIIAPDKFLPAAERFGMIGEIDLWVVRQAATLAATGRAISFNLSGDSLGRTELIGKIAAILAASGADPGRLICEITETALASEPAVAEASVRRLADSGCAIALDDFGTGYGGFSYIKRLPVQHVKIDVEFVHDLCDNPQNQHVVKAIVNLAQAFEKKTTAEGVEEERTLELLSEYGVDYAQGYAIGRPAPVQDVFTDNGQTIDTTG